MLGLPLPEMVKVTTATTGTGTLTLGAAIAGFMGTAQLVDGKRYPYTILDVNGADIEAGLGTYTASGTSFARDTVTRSKISGTEGTTKLTLSGTGSTVMIGPSGQQAGSLYALSYGDIIGLYPKWTSNTVLGATPGAAYIESLEGAIFAAPADITPSSPSNNTWYHVYLKTDGTLEAVTAAPVAFATPIGDALSKTSDTTRRYLYSVVTDGSGHFRQFIYMPTMGVMRWTGQINAAPFSALAGGTATAATTLDCAAVAPPTAREIFIQGLNLSDSYVFLSSADVSISSSTFQFFIAPCSLTGNDGNTIETLLPCSSSQVLKYMLGGAASGGGMYLDVHGYGLRR